MTETTFNTPLCFIGGGNMASSLIGGLIAGGHNASAITVCDPSDDQRRRLESTYSIATSSEPVVASAARAVVLAVKPHTVEPVCTALAPLITEDTVVISVAAGTQSCDINRWLGGGRRVVRCMPNTPALYGKGASVLFAADGVNGEQQTLASYILEAAGKVWWVQEEDQLDAVTALSGSGPAYGFLLIECMTDAGAALGLERDLAEQLAVQTLLGAATMAEQDSRDPATLREGVTSKGGTTAAALNTFEAGDFRGLVASAMTAARDRARELAKPTGVAT